MLAAFAFLTLFFRSFSYSGSRPTVFSEEGQSVQIQCSLAGSVLTGFEFWVHWFKRGPHGNMEQLDTDCDFHQSTSCKYHTALRSEEKVLLKIFNVTSMDAGDYYCSDHKDSYLRFADKGTRLIVRGEEAMTANVYLLTTDYRSANLNGNDNITLVCLVNRLSTDQLSVRWILNGTLASQTLQSSGLEVQKQHNSGYVASSFLIMPIQIWLSGVECTCEVQLSANTSIHSKIVTLQAFRNQKESCFDQYVVFIGTALGFLLLFCFASLVWILNCEKGVKHCCHQKRGDLSTDFVQETNDTVTYAHLDFNSH
ncbi:uncharacterized protein LOC114644307 [Erpetoichthys calabaricus]|uniref:uncharacterized protein LOC114644307 n=1 Tax=Erpetoichthys calabaricus TaxID=27687 RepID=UPI00109FF951|nr:uncharacterized protein LOC114644307 [Erpetoichthys calabaricus]